MKKKSSELKDTPDSNVTLSGIIKHIASPILWITAIVVSLWSLMHFSIPESKLEPYTKFQKTSTSFEDTVDPKSEPELEHFAETDRLDFSDMAVASPELTSADGQLPRETLQHIKNGMQLISTQSETDNNSRSGTEKDQSESLLPKNEKT